MESEGPTESSEASEKSLFCSQQEDEEGEAQGDVVAGRAEENNRGAGPLLRPALTGDMQDLQAIFEDPENPHYQHAMQLLLEEDIVGRNLLYAACMAGQSDVIRALAKYGVNLNARTTRGYTLLHCAAAWGRLETLKALVELDADIEAQNYWQETPRDVADRYSQTECMEFLDWAEWFVLPRGSHCLSFSKAPLKICCYLICLICDHEKYRTFPFSPWKVEDARLTLKKYITKVFTGVTDTEKGQPKLFKEDKNTILGACRLKSEWLETHQQASVKEIYEQKQQLEDIVTPIYAKMTQARQVRSAKSVY